MGALLRQRSAGGVIAVILILSSVGNSLSTVQDVSNGVSSYRNPHSNEIQLVHRFLKDETKFLERTTLFNNSKNNENNEVINNRTQVKNDVYSTVKSDVSSVVLNLERNCLKSDLIACFKLQVIRFAENATKSDTYVISEGIKIKRAKVNGSIEEPSLDKVADEDEYLFQKLRQMSRSHVVSIEVPRLSTDAGNALNVARRWVPNIFKLPSIFKPSVAGKSSFLTGFGLGFLAFGLKKLLLPLFIGAQIVKSVLIAMFLPSILGGLGKLVGKGVSTFAGASGGSGSAGADANAVDDFDFKDNVGYEDPAGSASSYSGTFTYPDQTYASGYLQNTINRTPALMPGTLPAAALYLPPATSVYNRYQPAVAAPKISYAVPTTSSPYSGGSYYTRHKQQDFKVFHQIPSSSMLLTSYDPFYSPLLSRLDSVFQQLGYNTEACRERLVCAMYMNPAKFAPYSNLVSAQLSRELNELRKPSTDNPEILRFFRYMKAAKDGQDGKDCFQQHPGCVTGKSSSSSPPMVMTYNDINKLVQARRLSRNMASNKEPSVVGDRNNITVSSHSGVNHTLADGETLMPSKMPLDLKTQEQKSSVSGTTK